MTFNKILDNGKIVGNYTIERYLETGGLSCMYLAKDHSSKRVVIKIPGECVDEAQTTPLTYDEVTDKNKPDVISYNSYPTEVFLKKMNGFLRYKNISHEEINRIFKEEYKKLRIDSNVIVSPIDLIKFEDTNALVLPYSAGKNLREHIKNLQRVPTNIFYQISQELKKFTNTGFYHGDIKPENIIIMRNKSVKLINPSVKFDLEDVRVIIATPDYNPLLLENGKADIMAIGITMYELFTGILPFKPTPWKHAGKNLVGESLNRELEFYLSITPISDIKTNDNKNPKLLLKDLETVINKCLNPFKHYCHTELSDDLHTILYKQD